MKNRYFIDTEFIEDGRTIDLISIGIVCGDGRAYYAVNREMNKVHLFDNLWLVANVVPHLPLRKYKPDEPWSWTNCDEDFSDPAWRTRDQICHDLIEFIKLSVPSPVPGAPDEILKPQIWGYYADYDWVAICQIFGRMLDLPSGWPMYCMDLKQLANTLGIDRYPQPAGEVEHHALADAQWNLDSFLFARAKVTEQSDSVTVGILENFLGL